MGILFNTIQMHWRNALKKPMIQLKKTIKQDGTSKNSTTIIETKLDTFEPSDTVSLRDTTRGRRTCPKFRIRWKGLYEVVRRLSDLNYLVRLSKNKERVVNINKIKKSFLEPEPRPTTVLRKERVKTDRSALQAYAASTAIRLVTRIPFRGADRIMTLSQASNCQLIWTTPATRNTDFSHSSNLKPATLLSLSLSLTVHLQNCKEALFTICQTTLPSIHKTRPFCSLALYFDRFNFYVDFVKNLLLMKVVITVYTTTLMWFLLIYKYTTCSSLIVIFRCIFSLCQKLLNITFHTSYPLKNTSYRV